MSKTHLYIYSLPIKAVCICSNLWYISDRTWTSLWYYSTFGHNCKKGKPGFSGLAKSVCSAPIFRTEDNISKWKGRTVSTMLCCQSLSTADIKMYDTAYFISQYKKKTAIVSQIEACYLALVTVCTVVFGKWSCGFEFPPIFLPEPIRTTAQPANMMFWPVFIASNN